MKPKLLNGIIALLLAMPLSACAQSAGQDNDFTQQQKQKIVEQREKQKRENREFRQSLKDKNPDQVRAAINEHSEAQYQESMAFRAKLHQENTAVLKAKLDSDAKLTAAEKADILNLFESQYQEKSSFIDKQHGEDVSFFRKIAGDVKITPEQRKEAIKAHVLEQRANRAELIKQQKAAKQAKMEKIGAEIAARNPASAPSAAPKK